VIGLSRQRAALLVVDIQDRLAPAMPAPVLDHVIRNTSILVEAAKRLGLPVVVSQQYPKGLGQTIEPLAKLLPDGAHRFDKVDFSAASHIPLLAGRDQWIVTGMETHICVYQTARGLVDRGWQPHVAIDACCSRTKLNWEIGRELMTRAGAVVSSTETVVFDLLGCAGTEDFKALSRAIK
jgi:nicotinamidase-related amidase